MANQIDTLKAMIAKQAAIPKAVTMGTPIAPLGEGLSGILASIAEHLPKAPAIPTGIPALPMAIPQIPKVTEFVKSLEAGLPAGLPKVGQAVSQAIPPLSKKAPELIFE